MALAINCPCGAHLEIDDKFAGQTIQCPDCQRSLQAPALERTSLRTSGLAITSLILALVGAFTVIGTIVAVVVGAVALRSIARERGQLTGGSYAVAGIVLGMVFTALSLFVYVKVELFGLDRLLREPEWAGMLDYGDAEEASDNGLSLTRPSKTWGVYRPRDTHDLGFGPFGGRHDYLILVNVPEDAQAIAFFFLKNFQMEDSADSYRGEALRLFGNTKLVELMTRKGRTHSAPEELSGSRKELPAVEGRLDFHELLFSITIGKHDRKFVMRFFRNGDQIFVVAAGARKDRFAGLEAQLRKIVTSFKAEPGFGAP